MARYDADTRNRVWYGGGGVDDGDSDVEFGYSAGGFGHGNYGGRSEPGGQRRGSRGGGYDSELVSWRDRSRLRGRGQGNYDRGYRQASPPSEARYGGEFRQGGRGGQRPFTGMESNRYRGVYDSGFRAREGDWNDSHGGYRGTGWNRGGGMNPGRGRRS